MKRISDSSCSQAGAFVQAVNGTRLGKLILKPLHDAVSETAKTEVRKSQLADRALALEASAQRFHSLGRDMTLTDVDILEQAGNFKAVGDVATSSGDDWPVTRKTGQRCSAGLALQSKHLHFGQGT